MPEAQERYPVARFMFEVVSLNLKGGFSKVTGIKEEIAVEDKRDGTDPLWTRKVRGVNKGGQVTLERGVIVNFSDFVRWFETTREGEQEYLTDVVIGVNDEGGEVRRMKLERTWPNSYELGDLDAKASEVAFESIGLVFERIKFLL